MVSIARPCRSIEVLERIDLVSCLIDATIAGRPIRESL